MPMRTGPVAPLDEMRRVLDRPPARIALTGDAAAPTVTGAWTHGPLHDRTAAMSDHVFMTYVGAARAITRRSGLRTERGSTRRGTVTLIPAGAESRWDIEGDLSVVHLYLAPARIAAFAERNGARPSGLVERTAFADETGARLLTMLAEAATGPGRLDTLFADQAAELLCAHLLRAHSGASLPAPEARGGLAPWQVRRITDYLEAHLADPVTLAELAALVDLSPWHLCRAFRQSTGLPPHRWRAARRIERARALLEQSDMSVIEIALNVGYDGASQFSAAFKAAVGTAPSAYRQKCRG